MEKKEMILGCTECPLCGFTRNSKSESFFYKIARKVQSKCPACKQANEALNKDYQKSLHIK